MRQNLRRPKIDQFLLDYHYVYFSCVWPGRTFCYISYYRAHRKIPQQPKKLKYNIFLKSKTFKLLHILCEFFPRYILYIAIKLFYKPIIMRLCNAKYCCCKKVNKEIIVLCKYFVSYQKVYLKLSQIKN